MISELTFSRKFTSYWNQLLPNANNFIRIVNGSLIDDVYPPLDENGKKENNVFVNECGFNLYVAIHNNIISEQLLLSNDLFYAPEFSRVIEKTELELRKFSYGSNFELPLSVPEYNSIKSIAWNILNRYRIYQTISSPLFSGCGIINNSYGDIYYPNTLVEIKSGDRKFSVYDLRQLLIYFTLNFYSREKRPLQNFELFNPRMGIVYNDDITILCRELAFIQPEEMFFQIMTAITDENFIDTEFQR
ncbi:TPA: hypothetical protein QID48_000033 [Klebsiella quasipneumoniae subsp. similipneumoniae]|jgi:hypothetical protein|nr:hypothetical protein [Klebsiella quasipneumoniae subsp. similipneumoniae]HDT3862902.1 hypothetical protein [Klebsiella quasipneumoniae subsp. similipneumoniae]HDU5368837.1 hypothetical protein [Klebsiella quasipneumoniae subsp. similipneumoniae]